MKNLFIAFTPYHVLLSCGIALDQKNLGENYLFIVSDFNNVEALIHSLKKWNQSPFIQIKCLPGMYGLLSKFKRRFMIRKNITAIIKFISRQKFRRIYVFNDGRPEAQAVLHFAKKNRKDVVGIYVEDGSAAYSSYRLRNLSFPSVLLRKLFYGLWWEHVSVLGTSRWIDEIKAIFPHLVRSELRSRPISSIPRHALIALRNQSVLYDYLELLGVMVEDFDKIKGILIVAHSEFANRIIQYKQIIKEVLDMAKSQDLRLAVKYHPRETRDDFLSINNIEEIFVLPKSLPIELIYILKYKQIKLVIGDISTSLLTAKWLLDNVTVLSLMSLLNQINPWLLKTFHELDIKIINDITEIRRILQQ